MIFQKSQPVETGHECLSSASTGSLKIWMNYLPHEKRTPTKCTKKLVTATARTGQYEEKAPHNADVGANRPRV
jgi:hypothetical protein